MQRSSNISVCPVFRGPGRRRRLTYRAQALLDGVCRKEKEHVPRSTPRRMRHEILEVVHGRPRSADRVARTSRRRSLLPIIAVTLWTALRPVVRAKNMWFMGARPGARELKSRKTSDAGPITDALVKATHKKSRTDACAIVEADVPLVHPSATRKTNTTRPHELPRTNPRSRATPRRGGCSCRRSKIFDVPDDAVSGWNAMLGWASPASSCLPIG